MRGIMAQSGPPEVLIARAREGDRAAFDELIGAFEDRLRSFIRSRIESDFRGRLDPEEILQDARVRAYLSIESFQGETFDEFRRWATGVANKTVLRAAEGARRHRILEIQPDLPAKDIPPSKAERREERLDRFQGAIDSLSADYREVLFLTRIEGLTLKQAAEKMGRSPEAVRKLFWRALKQLRSRISNTESLHLPDRELDWGRGDERRR